VNLELADLEQTPASRKPLLTSAETSIEQAIRLTSREEDPGNWLKYHEAALPVAVASSDGKQLTKRFDAILSGSSDLLIPAERLVLYLDAYYTALDVLSPAEKITMLRRAIERISEDAQNAPYRAKLHLLVTWVVLRQKDSLWKEYGPLATDYAEKAYRLTGEMAENEKLPAMFQRTTLRAEACVNTGYIAYANGVAFAKGSPTQAGNHQGAEPWFKREFERLAEAIELQPAVELTFKSRLAAADSVWQIYQGREVRRLAKSDLEPLLKEAVQLLSPMEENRAIDKDSREASKRLSETIHRVLAP
jgi:hypothetical protein